VVISYFGENCFRLQSGDTSLLVDAANNRLKADAALRTEVPVDAIGFPDPSGTIEIAFPGEYETKGIEIRGFPVSAESGKVIKTGYLVRWEEVKYAILPRFSKLGDKEVIEEVGEPDVLFLPLGGEGLAPDAALKFVRQIEPSVVIPSYSRTPLEFLKSMGHKGAAEEKFVFKSKDIVGKKNHIVLLVAKA